MSGVLWMNRSDFLQFQPVKWHNGTYQMLPGFIERMCVGDRGEISRWTRRGDSRLTEKMRVRDEGSLIISLKHQQRLLLLAKLLAPLIMRPKQHLSLFPLPSSVKFGIISTWGMPEFINKISTSCWRPDVQSTHEFIISNSCDAWLTNWWCWRCNLCEERYWQAPSFLKAKHLSLLDLA